MPSAASRPSRLVPFALAAAALAASLAGCRKPADDASSVAVTVRVAHPVVGPISDRIVADAILAPLSQAALTARITAPIRRFYVQRGDHVRSGQLLVTFEDRDLRGSALDSRGALLQARAAYTAATQAAIPEELQKAQLDVDQARANLDVANRTADERRRLLAEGAIAGRDTDTSIAAAVQAQAAYDMAVKHLSSVRQVTRSSSTEAARGALDSAQGRYSSAEAQLGYSSLRSPIRGVVTDRPLFAGETAASGTPVVTVMDTSALLAKLHLSQSAAQELRVGGKAEITLRGETEPREAVVSFIGPALDPGSTTVEVWLRLSNPDGQLKVGTPVHATITGDTVEHALAVPTSAILPGTDGSSFVMVVGADQLAHKRTVTLGIRTPEAVEITSGLKPADTVITEGSYGLDDGTRVIVGDSKTGSGEKD